MRQTFLDSLLEHAAAPIEAFEDGKLIGVFGEGLLEGRNADLIF